METSGERRAFLFGLTLSELAFLMFFLIVILSSVSLEKKNTELIELDENNKDLQHEIVQLRKELDEAFKKLRLLEEIQNTCKYLAEKFKLSEDELNELITRLVEEEKDKTDRVKKLEVENRDMMVVIESIRKITGNEGDYEELPKIISDMDSEVRISKIREGVLSGQVANYQRRFKGAGLDHPPCWADRKTGKIEYLYKILIQENSLEITPVSPEYRNATLLTIPNAYIEGVTTLDIMSFRKKMKGVLDWSKKQKPECRHFVRVKDEEKTTKTAFKRNLLTIENYFYKYLEVNGE